MYSTDMPSSEPANSESGDVVEAKTAGMIQSSGSADVGRNHAPVHGVHGAGPKIAYMYHSMLKLE